MFGHRRAVCAEFFIRTIYLPYEVIVGEICGLTPFYWIDLQDWRLSCYFGWLEKIKAMCVQVMTGSLFP